MPTLTVGMSDTSRSPHDPRQAWAWHPVQGLPRWTTCPCSARLGGERLGLLAVFRRLLRQTPSGPHDAQQDHGVGGDPRSRADGLLGFRVILGHRPQGPLPWMESQRRERPPTPDGIAAGSIRKGCVGRSRESQFHCKPRRPRKKAARKRDILLFAEGRTRQGRRTAEVDAACLTGQ